MAAIFYIPTTNENTLFKNNMQVNTAVSVPFLFDLVGPLGFLIVSEVTVQNRDTIQYFLTFDDLISYFYFGKGLGTISINGLMFSDCNGYFRGLNMFNNMISRIRGSVQNISFGNAVFSGVISAFTMRASADEGMNNAIEFNLQLDVIDHSLVPPRFTPTC
jgi:hypothetical protein